MSTAFNLEEKPPEDMLSRKGFRKGRQAMIIAALSWIVVAR